MNPKFSIAYIIDTETDEINPFLIEKLNKDNYYLFYNYGTSYYDAFLKKDIEDDKYTKAQIIYTYKRNYRCEYHVISKIGSNICLRSVNIKVLKN